jgi:arabinofuranan 3-O-arabinosyltransferase
MGDLRWTNSGAARPAAIPLAVFLISAVFVALNTVHLAALYAVGEWIRDRAGHYILADFVTLWSAGALVRDGHVTGVYDWEIAKQAQVAVTGVDYTGHLAFHYPPPFLFVVAALAYLPFGVSYVGWIIATFAPYAAVVRALVGRPIGWWLALAFPALFYNFVIGQNGCLTAALIGGTLFFLPARPIVAGICLGLLTYKPQYGPLFPLVLVATGQWRAILSAAATTATIAAVSWFAFGSDTWLAFFHWAPMTPSFLTNGEVYFGKLQSMLGFVRFAGGSEGAAWIAHWILAATVAVTLVALWRSSVCYELKAAALATGAVLATPYVFMYDLVVLAIPMALLIRLGFETGFRKIELYALWIATGLLVSFDVFIAPVGFIAALVLAGLIADRALIELGFAQPHGEPVGARQ